MGAIIAFVVANKAVLAFGLFGISEMLALIPSVKANSVFQLVQNGLKSVAEKK